MSRKTAVATVAALSTVLVVGNAWSRFSQDRDAIAQHEEHDKPGHDHPGHDDDGDAFG